MSRSPRRQPVEPFGGAGWSAMARLEAAEAASPSRPPVPRFRLFPDLDGLRALVEERRLARAAAVEVLGAPEAPDAALGRDMVEARRCARQVDRKLRSHGVVASAPSARSSPGASPAPAAPASAVVSAAPSDLREGSPPSRSPPPVKQPSLL